MRDSSEKPEDFSIALAPLASCPGGRIFYPQGFDRLNEAFADIIRELRTQYLLGFYPRGTREERRLHPVRVSTKNAFLRVTARTGYYEP